LIQGTTRPTINPLSSAAPQFKMIARSNHSQSTEHATTKATMGTDTHANKSPNNMCL
jgi:hypothetical protein